MSYPEQQEGKEPNKYITNRTINSGYGGIKTHTPGLCVDITERTAYRIKTIRTIIRHRGEHQVESCNRPYQNDRYQSACNQSQEHKDTHYQLAGYWNVADQSQKEDEKTYEDNYGQRHQGSSYETCDFSDAESQRLGQARLFVTCELQRRNSTYSAAGNGDNDKFYYGKNNTIDCVVSERQP